MRTATTSMLTALLMVARPAAAADDSASDREPPAASLAIQGGKGTAALVAEAELRLRMGLVLGVAGGTARGPAVGGHLAYRLPFGSRWSLEPGVRAMTAWESAEHCGPSCQFNFLTLELGLHYRGPSGFVFEAGLPIVAWIPVGPDGGQSRPHLEPYVFSGEAFAYTASILFGYAVDL
jgi:hypothetical protein